MEGKEAQNRRGPWHYHLLWITALVTLVLTLAMVGLLACFRQQLIEFAGLGSQGLQPSEVGPVTVSTEVGVNIAISTTMAISDEFAIQGVFPGEMSARLVFSAPFSAPMTGELPLQGSFTFGPLQIPLAGTDQISETLTGTIVISNSVSEIVQIPMNLSAPLRGDAPFQANIRSELPVEVTFPIEQLAAMAQLVAAPFLSLLRLLAPPDFGPVAVAGVLLVGVALLLMVGRFALTRDRRKRVSGTGPRPLPVPPRNPRATLTIITGDTRLFQSFILYGDTRVGRSRQFAQLVFQETLDNSPISRLHCRFLDRGDHFALVDEESMNGTYVNGRRLTPLLAERLHDGDVVELGRVQIGGAKLRFNMLVTPASELPTELDLPAPDDI